MRENICPSYDVINEFFVENCRLTSNDDEMMKPLIIDFGRINIFLDKSKEYLLFEVNHIFEPASSMYYNRTIDNNADMLERVDAGFIIILVSSGSIEGCAGSNRQEKEGHLDSCSDNCVDSSCRVESMSRPTQGIS